MPKSLDGIKKLNPDELKKKREIVLDYIGEGKPKQVVAKPTEKVSLTPSKEVDGLKSKANKQTSGPVEQVIAVEKRDELEKIKAKEEEEKLKQAIKKQQEERKKILKEERLFIRKKHEDERQQRLQAKQESERKRQLEIQKRQQQLQKLIKEKEKVKQEELLKKLAEKREKQLLAKQERERKRLARAKKFKRFKKRLKKKFSKIYGKRKVFAYIILSLLAFFFVSYLVFNLILISFNVDNKYTRLIANYLPVPAYITNIGMINYYDYKDMTNRVKSNYNQTKQIKTASEIKTAVEQNLIRSIIYSDLAEKYKLKANKEDLEKILAIEIVKDRQINQIGISRIGKIYNLLNSGNNLETLKIYADDYSSGSYFSHDQALEKFGSVVDSLAVGQISNIIPTSQGYYIIRINDKSDNNLDLTYLFVKAETLDDYTNQQLSKIRVFSLVN